MSGEIVYCRDTDCYAILGVDSNCDDASIRRSYKRLLLKLHPDKHPVHARKEAHVPFTRMQNAYEILNDPRERRQYNTKRRAHFRAEFKAIGRKPSTSFDEWMGLQEEKIKLEEQSRQRKHDDLRKKKEQEANDARKEQEESKQRQREEQQRRWEERQREEQQRQRGDPFQEEIDNLEAERRQVQHNFKAWKARQKEERGKEVSEREAQRLELQQQYEQSCLQMAEAHKRHLEELLESHKRYAENQANRHERQKRAMADLHNKQSEYQRNERKRMREQYDSWLETTKEDIINLQNGLDTRAFKRAKRPEFNTPKYGRTKEGLPCQVCQQRGGFCAMHKDQQV